MAFASIKLQNSQAQEISVIAMDVLAGTSGGFNFSVCSIGENTSFVRLYNFSLFLNPIIPDNITNLKQNDCHQANITYSVPNTSIAKTYNERIIVLTSNESKEMIANIRVVESTIWNLSEPEKNISAKKGDFGQFNFTMKNSGNVEVRFRMTLVSNTNDPILAVDTSDFSIQPNSSFSRAIYYDMFRNLTPSVYSFNITFFDNSGNFRIFPIKINLTDIYPPVIDEIKVIPEDAELDQNIVISAIVKDDAGIRTVRTIINGNITNFTYYNESLYKLIYTDTKFPKDEDITITVTDIWNNIASKIVRIKVHPDNIVKSEREAFFNKIKTQQEREKMFIFTNKTTFLAFKLNSVVVENLNVTLSLFINGKPFNSTTSVILDQAYGEILLKVKENEIYKSVFDNTTNQTIKVLETNEDNYISDFKGEIEVTTDTRVLNPNKLIRFSGRFDKYSVSNPTSLVIPYFTNGVLPPNFSCMPTDNGIYEQSYYECKVKYPVDVHERELAVISTKEALDNLINGYERNLSYTSLERDAERTAKWITWIILLVMVAGGLVWFFILRTATFT